MDRLLTTWLAMVTVLGLTLGAGQARAQISLDIGNSDRSGETAPFATITLTDTTGSVGGHTINEVVFTVTAIDKPNAPKGTASFDQFSFNGPSGATLDSSSTLPSDWSFTAGPNNSKGPFGKFGYEVGSKNGNSPGTSTVTFTVDNLTSNQVLSGLGDKGYSFAARYFPESGHGHEAWVGTVVHPLTVPEPGPFVGAGVVTLIGLGYSWCRRRRPGRPCS
jgi:hypothetical protein